MNFPSLGLEIEKRNWIRAEIMPAIRAGVRSPRCSPQRTWSIGKNHHGGLGLCVRDGGRNGTSAHPLLRALADVSKR